jgi:hypothetical protein
VAKETIAFCVQKRTERNGDGCWGRIGTVIPNGTDAVLVAVEGDIVLAVRGGDTPHPWATWISRIKLGRTWRSA